MSQNETAPLFLFAPAFFAACGLLLVIVVVYFLFSRSREDWKRISEIKKKLNSYIEEVKKHTVELSIVLVEMQELLSQEGGDREKELDVLESRVKERVGGIKKVTHGDFREVEEFMKEVEAGTVLKSLSSKNVESFKKDMRQGQWLIACLKGYLTSLVSACEKLEMTRKRVRVGVEDAEETFSFCEIRKILKKMMEQISTYEMDKSMRRQEKMLEHNRRIHQPYYMARHRHNWYSNAGTSSRHSFQYSFSTPLVATQHSGHQRGLGVRAKAQAMVPRKSPGLSLAKPGSR